MKKDYTTIKKMAADNESTVVGMDIYAPVLTVASLPINVNDNKNKK
jgi:hypothetical protein